MEKAAFDQLHEQATEQKKLYANLKQDLSTERRKVVEYQWVIKVLSALFIFSQKRPKSFYVSEAC